MKKYTFVCSIMVAVLLSGCAGTTNSSIVDQYVPADCSSIRTQDELDKLAYSTVEDEENLDTEYSQSWFEKRTEIIKLCLEKKYMSQMDYDNNNQADFASFYISFEQNKKERVNAFFKDLEALGYDGIVGSELEGKAFVRQGVRFTVDEGYGDVMIDIPLNNSSFPDINKELVEVIKQGDNDRLYLNQAQIGGKVQMLNWISGYEDPSQTCNKSIIIYMDKNKIKRMELTFFGAKLNQDCALLAKEEYKSVTNLVTLITQDSQATSDFVQKLSTTQENSGVLGNAKWTFYDKGKSGNKKVYQLVIE